MDYLVLPARQVVLDQDGYLADADDWDADVALALASESGIGLEAGHWEVLELLRRFYASHQLVPAMRPLVKLVARELGPEKGNSLYLLTLFPGNPALQASRIAGLPRPANCF